MDHVQCHEVDQPACHRLCHLHQFAAMADETESFAVIHAPYALLQWNAQIVYAPHQGREKTTHLADAMSEVAETADYLPLPL